MNLSIPKTRKQLKQHLNDPLYKNSFFIMLTSIASAGFGFIFWMLAARLYSIEDVGVATALISSLGLVILFSRLGLDFSAIRFFPEKDKSKVFNTCLSITTIAAVVVGVIYISSVGFFAPTLSFIQSPRYAILFLAFAVMNFLFITQKQGHSELLMDMKDIYLY